MRASYCRASREELSDCCTPSGRGLSVKLTRETKEFNMDLLHVLRYQVGNVWCDDD